MAIFVEYSRCYDLLYADKDYHAEVVYVAQHIRTVTGGASTILELGCGTGKHAQHFGAEGFAVHGVDLSSEMIEIARSNQRVGLLAQTFEVGDVRSIRLGRQFDCVLSLFHVMSYQTTNEDVRSTFQTAFEHTLQGGCFLFDCWYGPGVLTDPPVVRVKRVSSESLDIMRIAEPTIHSLENVVQVDYSLRVLQKATGCEKWVMESHRMRYFFVPEIKLMLEEAGFSFCGAYKWMSEEEPGLNAWNALIVGKKL
jgi:SAM-dependent methyltransferase